MVVGCWYQMRRNQHGRKNCNSIERNVRVFINYSDEKTARGDY